jgi:hypothetical protein
MPQKPWAETETYPEEEAQRRFEAALRGARIAGMKNHKDAPQQRPESKAKARKAVKPSS